MSPSAICHELCQSQPLSLVLTMAKPMPSVNYSPVGYPKYQKRARQRIQTLRLRWNPLFLAHMPTLANPTRSVNEERKPVQEPKALPLGLKSLTAAKPLSPYGP